MEIQPKLRCLAAKEHWGKWAEVIFMNPQLPREGGRHVWWVQQITLFFTKPNIPQQFLQHRKLPGCFIVENINDMFQLVFPTDSVHILSSSPMQSNVTRMIIDVTDLTASLQPRSKTCYVTAKNGDHNRVFPFAPRSHICQMALQLAIHHKIG